MESIGRYLIKRKLAEGGMATIYLAEDPNIRREVAVKLFKKSSFHGDEKSLRMVYAEAQSQGTLSHPNICVIYDTAEERGIPYIVMELLDGPSLAGLLGQSRRFTVPEVLDMMIELCAALEYAHAKGVVHRDIKPGNIIRLGNGHIKLTDFGIAQVIGGSARKGAGHGFGTPGYMSPEQADGRAADHRTDIFSAGVLLYELLTGTKAFKGKTSTDYRSEIGRMDIPAPSQLAAGIPSELDAVVIKAMARNPDSRYRNASEMKGALVALKKRFAGVPGASAPVSTTGGPAGTGSAQDRGTQKLARKKLSPAVWVISGGLVLAVVIGLWAVLSGPGKAPASSTAVSSQPAPPPIQKPPTLDELLTDVDAALASRRADEAERILNNIDREYPNSAAAFYKRAMIAFDRSLPYAGISYLQDALRIQPEFGAARLKLALALEAAGKKEEALTECRRLVPGDGVSQSDIDQLRNRLEPPKPVVPPKAASAPKPTPRMGKIAINTKPRDVLVSLQYQESSPFRWVFENQPSGIEQEVEEGKYQVIYNIQETGEDDRERSSVVVKAGETFPLYHEFTAAVSLNYDKSAPGPKDFFIVIDGKIKATLPWTGVLLVGKHVFVCEAPDGRHSRPETKLIFFNKTNAFVFSWND